MFFSELVVFENLGKKCRKFFIIEENVKVRLPTKSFNIGGFYQYSGSEYSNRFLYWIINNNLLTITELSTDHELLENQISIEFGNSDVLSVHIFENEGIDFLIAASHCILRFSVHHPSKLRRDTKGSSPYSIFYDVSTLNEQKHLITPYIRANEITSVNTVIFLNNVYFNFGLNNGNVCTISTPDSQYIDFVNFYEMTETSLLSKFFSGIIPRSNESCFDRSILDMAYVVVNNKLLVCTVSKDNKLKIWSLNDKYLVGSEDLLPYVLESDQLPVSQHGNMITSHKIKSFYSNTKNEMWNDMVIVYFHAISGKTVFSNWLVLRIINSRTRSSYDGHFEVRCNIAESNDSLNLIDFRIGTDIMNKNEIGIWRLFSDQNSTNSVSWIGLDDQSDTKRMNCRVYNESKQTNLIVHEHQDPQEAILDQLFSSGYFSRQAIINTINKFRQSDNYIPNDVDTDELKRELVLIVENRVDNELMSSIEVEPEIDVIELNHKQWNCLYHEVMEEQVIVTEPIGLMSVAGTIGINRGSTISLLRRGTALECAVSSTTPSESLKDIFEQTYVISGCALLKYLYDCSSSIQDSEYWGAILYRLMKLGCHPLEIVQDILLINPQVPTMINTRLEHHPVILEKIVNILETMDLFDEKLSCSNSTKDSLHLSFFGNSLLHYALCQLIRDRITLSLSLLALIEPRIINSPQSVHLTNLVTRLVRLVKFLVSIYFLLTIRQKTTVELSDILKNQYRCLNLLENRLPTSCGSDVLYMRVLQSIQTPLKVVSNDVNEIRHWQTKLSADIVAVLNCLNPDNDSFVLFQIAKYFLSYNMPLQLLDYLQYLTNSKPNNWWSGDRNLVAALCGLCYSQLGKPWKGIELIMESVYQHDLSSSTLPDIILSNEDRESIDTFSKLQLASIMKFIDAVGDMNDCEPLVITLVHRALDECSDEKAETIGEDMDCDGSIFEYRSTLLNILFDSHLSLKQVDEAWSALIENPDTEKQKNCLRRFIMTMFDENRLQSLVSYDYKHLKAEFINIVSARARSADLVGAVIDCPFYSVLFSFYVQRDDYKSAAHCMLEQALRLDDALSTQLLPSVAIDCLQRQMRMLLCCINACDLLPIDQRLFVFPSRLVRGIRFSMNTNDAALSLDASDNRMDVSNGSNNDDGDDEDNVVGRTVVTYDQIRSHYLLIRCRIRILRENSDSGFIRSDKLTSSCVLSGLLRLGLYWDALSLCRQFSISMETVVTTIAARCASSSTGCLDRPALKEKENVIDALEEIGSNATDYASLGNLPKLLWRLLEEVLHLFDTSPSGDLHVKACRKLLQSGISRLPSWLIDAVVEQKQAAAPLIRLFVQHGLVEHAVDVALRVLCSRIDELCSAQEIMSVSCTPATAIRMRWISYPTIFQLMDILDHMRHRNIEGSTDLFVKLQEKLNLVMTFAQERPTLMSIQSA